MSIVELKESMENIERNTNNEQKGYFEEYVNMKTQYDGLLMERQSLIDKQQNYNFLEEEYTKILNSNQEMKAELTEMKQKLMSHENKSFEIPVKDDLKAEIGRLNQQIQLLNTDLEETSTSYEKADEKCCELESQIDDVSTTRYTWISRFKF